MMKDIQVYNGNKPFFFVSYAHKDTERIAPYLKALQDAGYNFWFDKGIEAGTEWSNNIAEHLSSCSAFLFFASKNSVKSENCLDEVAYAKSHNKPALLVFVDDDAELPSGTEMQTARFQRIFLSRQESFGQFVENFEKASFFNCCRNDGAAPLSEEAYKPIKKETKTKSKAPVIGIIAGVVVIALIVALVVILGKKTSDNKPSDESQSEATTIVSTDTAPNASEQATEKTPEITELSDSLSDFTFRLDGVIYQLPASLSSFTDNGWTISAGANPDDYLAAHGFVKVNIAKNNVTISVDIYNNTEDAKQIKDSMVGGIEVSKNDNADFCIAGGITVDSTPEEAIEKLGNPTDKNEYSMNWEFGDDKCVRIYTYSDTPEYNFIRLENIVYADNTASAPSEAPAYLDDYKSPAALGDDFSSGIISVDSVLYQLPVPVREFVNNGWSASSGATEIMSGNYETITFSNGSLSFTANVVNYSPKKALTENCIIVSLTIDATDAPAFTLPGNITSNISKSDFAAIATANNMEEYEGSYYFSYSYELENDSGYSEIEISFDKETGAFYDIKIVKYTTDKIIIE